MQDDIRSTPAVPPVKPKPEPSHPPKAFLTPDQIAARDGQDADLTIDMANESPRQSSEHATLLGSTAIKPNSDKSRHKFWPPSKKQAWTGAAVLVVVLAAAGGIVYLVHAHKPVTASAAQITKPKTSDTVASTLSGLPVAPSVNQRPITAVMIENTPDARPQAGLSQAGVIFEALTEGGVTRFMALFQNQLPTFVGPVRSARPYFIDWDLGFDAPYVHAGGSPQALSQITSDNVENIDLLDYSNYGTRIASRPAPHNLYTSIPSLMQLEASLGWTSSSFSGWPRQAAAPAKHPTVTSINFNLSYSTYNVSYAYDAATNSYNRSDGGSPQTDANTGKQLSPKVVIGIVVPWSQGALDTTDAYYSVYQDTGSGEALVFQDGALTIGQWNKSSATSPLTFTLDNGQPLKLIPGQAWVTALASTNEANYN